MSAPRRRPRGLGRDESEIWAPLALLLAGVLAVLVLVAALPGRQREPEVPPPRKTDAQLLALLDRELVIAERWQTALGDLCDDPELQVEGLSPHCRTGTIVIGDDLFDPDDAALLTDEGIRKLHVAMEKLLAGLRADPMVWNSLEAIELRGHADPRAQRDPYRTNMAISQRRPMAIMNSLIRQFGLSERDRIDLERLMVLSAASYSRPPASCPERTRECYPYWRRVEIIPRLDGSARRLDHERFVRRLVEILD